MEWKKRKLTINVWESGSYRIINDADPPDTFRLESPIADDEYFPTLETAKANAALKNELSLYRDEAIRLRAELDELRRGDDFERRAEDFDEPPVDADAIAAELIEVMAANDAADHVAASDEPDPWFDGDGRGVPARRFNGNTLPMANAGPNDQPF